MHYVQLIIVGSKWSDDNGQGAGEICERRIFYWKGRKCYNGDAASSSEIYDGHFLRLVSAMHGGRKGRIDDETVMEFGKSGYFIGARAKSGSLC